MAHRGNEVRPALTVHSYVLAVFCMLFGFALGYLFRGSASPAASPVASTASPTTASMAGGVASTSFSSQSEALGHAASALLDTLKTNPNDSETLVKLGNLYFDGQQWQNAAQYYERALKLHPENVDVRTDMGTCYWNLGDAGKALTEFNRALTYRPDYAQTLFNIGIVKFQGKNDPQGAIEAWQRLLNTHPDYPNKQQVLDLIARARTQGAG